MPRQRLPDRPDALWHITQRVNWQVWHLEPELSYEFLRSAARAEDYARSSARFWAGAGESNLPLLARGEPLFQCEPQALRRFVSKHQGCDRFDAVMTALEESGLRAGTEENAQLLERLLDEVGLPSLP